ncbi:MAG: DnaJ domain-containing protein [Desulfobacterales bacterium]|jgi:curved DNA-binding protein CbpA
MNNTSAKFTNYYELLGIDPAADSEKMRQAYLKKIKEWHPDINPERIAKAEEMTKILNLAYHVLGDPARRKNYDRMLKFTRGKDFGEFVNDEAIRNKINKAYPALKKVLENVRELYALFKDSVKGNYKLHPANVAMIGGGLLYFILPADLIPDFIPLVGYLDDLAVLTTIMNSLKGEINQYRNWKETGIENDFKKSSKD